MRQHEQNEGNKTQFELVDKKFEYYTEIDEQIEKLFRVKATKDELMS